MQPSLFSLLLEDDNVSHEVETMEEEFIDFDIVICVFEDCGVEEEREMTRQIDLLPVIHKETYIK